MMLWERLDGVVAHGKASGYFRRNRVDCAVADDLPTIIRKHRRKLFLMKDLEYHKMVI